MSFEFSRAENFIEIKLKLRIVINSFGGIILVENY